MTAPIGPIGQAFACIRKEDRETYCGRTRDLREWGFTSREHAIVHYDRRVWPKYAPKGVLYACESCIDAAKASLKAESKG